MTSFRQIEANRRNALKSTGASWLLLVFGSMPSKRSRLQPGRANQNFNLPAVVIGRP
jgi:hypothetical protein